MLTIDKPNLVQTRFAQFRAVALLVFCQIKKFAIVHRTTKSTC